MADLTITLGGIAFEDFEVPDRISGLGGDQTLVIHRLAGGDRVVDSLGRDDAPISWGGRFRGGDAIDRARAIDALRIAGSAVDLTFGDFAYTVVIERFTYEIERFYEVPYSLSLVVVADNSAASAAREPSVDDMMLSDDTWALSLGQTAADPTLSGLLAGMDSAIAQVTDFVTASRATLQNVQAPIFAVQDRVSALIDAADLNPVIGGVVPGLPPDILASSVLTQVAEMTSVANLYDLQNVTGRLSKNLSAVGTSGAYVVQAGGDLFRLAERAYGDATEWAQIARANGLTDPVIKGTQSVLVPPLPGGAQGVLKELYPAPSAGAFPFAETAGAVGQLDFRDPSDAIFTALI